MNPILNFYYGELELIEGTLSCEECFSVSSKGEYNRKAKVLRWKCVDCDHLNVVKDFDL